MLFTSMLQAIEPQMCLSHGRRLSISVYHEVFLFSQSRLRLWACWTHPHLTFSVNWVGGWVRQLEMFSKQFSCFRDCLLSSNITT